MPMLCNAKLINYILERCKSIVKRIQTTDAMHQALWSILKFHKVFVGFLFVILMIVEEEPD